MPDLTQCDAKQALKEQLGIFKTIADFVAPLFASAALALLLSWSVTNYQEHTAAKIIAWIYLSAGAAGIVAFLTVGIYVLLHPSINLLLCLVGWKQPPSDRESANGQN